jgi:hypothetical protein
MPVIHKISNSEKDSQKTYLTYGETKANLQWHSGVPR